MKKRMIKKRMPALFLALVLMLGIAYPANALEISPSPTGAPTVSEPEAGSGEQDNKMAMAALGLEDSDLLIPKEAAQYIAEFFIGDMINAGQTLWNSNTSVIKVVTLYDETGENPTGYSCELTEGYIVVAAYADMPNPILEWSDSSEPLYKDATAVLGRSSFSDEKIVYLGPVSCYIDEGDDKLLTVNGDDVSDDNLKENLTKFRSVDNLSNELIETIGEQKHDTNDKGIVTYSYKDDPPNTSEGYIDNVFTYAKNVYKNNNAWVSTSDWKNYWEDYVSNRAYMEDFPNYQECCGPVAITNLIRMYGRKYNKAYIQGLSRQSIFNKVIEVNNKLGDPYTGVYIYQNRPSNLLGGTDNNKANELMQETFNAYTTEVKVWGPYDANISNIKNAVGTPRRLMYLMLEWHKCYGNHAVVGYAYNTLHNSITNDTRNFLKICDGKKGLDGTRDTSRYIDISVIGDCKYWEVCCPVQ